MQGTAFASNIGVADYFWLMHGLTRQQWLKDLAEAEYADNGTGYAVQKAISTTKIMI